jgi:hypothetical protein
MSAGAAGRGGPFLAVDLPLLEAIALHNPLVRSLLCTLARRGAALRRDEPQRARAWIDTLSVHPYYKGGQFLFDLLEWEDFMLDGEAPVLLDDAALSAVLDRAAQGLGAFGAALEGRPLPVDADAARLAVPLRRAPLPELAGNAHLYPDVVLGAISFVTAGRIAAARTSTPAP